MTTTKTTIMRAIVLVLFMACITSLQAQTTPNYSRNEIAINPLRVGWTNNTINPVISVRAFNSMVYRNRLKTSLWWTTEAMYGCNRINDDLANGADHYSGEGLLKEFQISSGLRRNIPISPSFEVICEGQAFFLHTTYAGDFEGGFNGTGLRLDRFQNIVGLSIGVGVQAQVHSNIYLAASSTLQVGQYDMSSRSDEFEQSGFGITNANLLQLSMAYRF